MPNQGARTLHAASLDSAPAARIWTQSGRAFFAIAIIGLGIEHFIFREFITGRAPPWPAGVPGEPFWAYLTGAIIVLSGAAILSGRMARLAALGLAALIFFWALLRNIPIAATSEILAPTWTHTVKALALFGGSLLMAALFPKLNADRTALPWRVINGEHGFVITARICLAVFMINNGLQHFIYTDFVASLIPTWFPGNAVFWTYFASAALFAGALGMLYPRTATLAALLTAIMVFSWVWIVHVPRVFLTKSDNIAVFEALAIAGIAFVLAGFTGRASRPAGLPARAAGEV